MTIKAVIIERGSQLPDEFVVRLSSGAMILFGQDPEQSMASLNVAGGSDYNVILGERAEDLVLPPTIMLWAILIFMHLMPGIKDRGPSQQEQEKWRDILFDRLLFFKGSEPVPKIEFLANPKAPEIILMLTWNAPAEGDWQGVHTNQIKRVAVALDRRYLRALRPPVSGQDLPGPDWMRFEHPDELFSLAHPKRWRQVPSVSRGAALSCLADDGTALLEVLCMHSDVVHGPREPHFADIIADGIVKIPDDFSNGRVLARREIARGPGGKCVRIVLSFRESGQDLTAEYFIAGAAHDALYVALKSPTASHESNLPDFTRVLSTLKTPWLGETGAVAASNQR
jgi:hypothetical protein